MGIKEQHFIMMRRLRTLLPKTIKIVYKDNKSINVPCTLAKENIDAIKYDKYVGQNILLINILIQDLELQSAPIKDFLYVIYDRKEYQVDSFIKNGIFDNSLQLTCKLHTEDN